VSVHVYQEDDSVQVECTFVYQSIADGCHIELTTDGSIIQSFNISLNNESNIASQYITLSVNGIYSIRAYDIINGIITNTPSVQYNDILYITMFTPSSTIISSDLISLLLTSLILLPSCTSTCTHTYKANLAVPLSIIGIFIIFIIILLSIPVIFAIIIFKRKKCMCIKKTGGSKGQLFHPTDHNNHLKHGSRPESENITSSFPHYKRVSKFISSIHYC
jgi:hypothetical protein